MHFIVKKQMMIGVAAVAISLIGYSFFFGKTESKQEEKDPIFTELEQPDEETVEQKPEVIKVDVKGAVQTSGVFTAERDDRVIDVIKEAGDFTEDADVNQVNLAQVVEDQMVIYVPEIGEKEEEIPAIVSPSVSGSVSASGTTGDKVNINTASQEQLEALTGIGPAKALDIIEYRETKGKFQQLEELKNISGIGDKTFEKLQDLITVK